MWKSVAGSKDFGIKHYLRIRARGSLDSSGTMPSNTMKNGTFYFEALVPDINLQVVPVHPLPILSTAMATTLLETTTSSRINAAQNLTPSRRVNSRLATLEATNMGYMTLNQTRKVVFLADSDSSLTCTPVVGVWVRINVADNIQAANEYDWASLSRHPYCWTAAMRFLYHQRVGKRVFVAHDTFLLVNN